MAILKIWDGSKEVEIPMEDPTLYLLLDGTRAMTGALDMGSQAIVNVGNVDGVDVSAHAADTNDPHGAIQQVSGHIVTPRILNIGDITLDAFSAASHTTVHVSNPDATYEADLNVERNIIVGGTVDGRDIAADGGVLDTALTAAAVIADNALVRGDGGARGTQSSPATLTDGNSLSVTRVYSNNRVVTPVVYGSEAIGGDLILASTDQASQANRGKIFFGRTAATGAWDETKPSLGIGTTDPGGIIANTMLDIRKDQERASIGLFTFHDTNATRGSTFYGGRARGDIDDPDVVINGDRIFSFIAVGYDGATWRTRANIFFDVDGVPADNSMPIAISFRTGAAAAVERLCIQSDGDILVDSGTTVFVRDTGLGFNSSVDGQLDVFADTEVEITTPLIDLNAASIFASTLISGTDQADAGAAAGELYVDTNDDNTVKRGV